MEFKEEANAQNVTSSSDVTATGALDANVNQTMAPLQPENVTIGQPIANPATPDQFGPPTEIVTQPHGPTAVSQPPPPAYELPAGQQLPQPGEAMNPTAQVCQGVPIPAVEAVSALSRGVEQNLVIAEQSQFQPGPTAGPVLEPPGATLPQLPVLPSDSHVDSTVKPPEAVTPPDRPPSTVVEPHQPMTVEHPVLPEHKTVDIIPSGGTQPPPVAVTAPDQSEGSSSVQAVVQPVNVQPTESGIDSGIEGVQLKSDLVNQQPLTLVESPKHQVPPTLPVELRPQPPASGISPGTGEFQLPPGGVNQQPVNLVEQPQHQDAPSFSPPLQDTVAVAAVPLQRSPPTIGEAAVTSPSLDTPSAPVPNGQPIRQPDAPEQPVSTHLAPSIQDGLPPPPAAVAQVGTEVIQVEQPTAHVAKATTPNDVIDTHDVIAAASDTDDAPEVISDSVSRDDEAANHHDHQHAPVGCRLSCFDSTSCRFCGTHNPVLGIQGALAKTPLVLHHRPFPVNSKKKLIEGGWSASLCCLFFFL